MFRYVMDTLSRIYGKRSRKSLLTTDRSVVRLPPGLFIPPSKERASYFRKLRALKHGNLARMTTSETNVAYFDKGVKVCELRLPGRDVQPRDADSDSD